MIVQRTGDKIVIVLDNDAGMLHLPVSQLDELTEKLFAISVEVSAEMPQTARGYVDERQLGHALEYADDEEIEVDVELAPLSEAEPGQYTNCIECGRYVHVGSACGGCGTVAHV